MRGLLFSLLGAAVLSSGTVGAHHQVPGRSHPTVTLGQDVLADGKPVPAGTYEIQVTDERPQLGAGAPSDAQRVVELVQNGQVIARTVAEVFPARGEAVGTSGTSGATRARAELLRGGEFLRVSFTDAGGRYLIHLPTGPLKEPAPQPQTPSRIELTTPATPSAPAPPKP